MRDKRYVVSMDMVRMTIIVIVMLFAIIWGKVPVHAAIASGTSGTCSWAIDDSKVLTISPSDGVSGMMNSYTGGNVPWYSNRSKIKKVVVEPGVKTNTGCYQLFYNLSNCTEMDLANLDTSNATNMSQMFNNCSALTSLDLSGFDTSSVTNMDSMFYNCRAITSLDLSEFDTSNVTTMSSMFQNCNALTSLDVSGFDTSNVTTLNRMFTGCSKLASLDISNFDTSNVIAMEEVFHNCSSLTSLDVSGFDTSKVTDMYGLFQGCSSLTRLDVSGFDTSKVTSMRDMFSGCSKLTSFDLSTFDTSNVTTMYRMFASCSSLTNLDVSGFNTSRVTNMSYIFYNCNKLTNLDVSHFDTSNVMYMDYMFWSCSGLTSLDVSGFDTSNVTKMGNMFNCCSSLTSLDVSGFDTSQVQDMNNMFVGCRGLNNLNVSNFNTEKVYNMASMFQGCSALTNIDASGFDTSNATNMSGMFSNCSSLTSLDVSGFDTSKVTTMSGMFAGSGGLTNLDLSSFDTSNVTDMNYMFSDCKALTNLDISGFDTSNVTSMERIFTNDTALTSINLGPKFSFSGKNITAVSGKALIPGVGGAKWSREDSAYGPYTTEELRDNYDGVTMSGVWVRGPMPKVKYAVQLYGIHEAIDQDGYTMGLTFGPAVGGNYVQSYKSHTTSGATEAGNAKRCIHDDDWETIIYWNYKDPEVYRECINEGCTHSVELDLSQNLRSASFDPQYTTGDGPGQLYYELHDSGFNHLRWNPLVEGGDTYYGTNKGGWGASRVRAMLNGADELTMKTSDSHYCSNAYNVTFDVENYIGSDTLIAAFPQELQHAIGKQEIKYDSLYNAQTADALKTSYDKLWLLSPNDIWTEDQNVTPDYAHSGEGTRLSRFASNTAQRSTSTQNITVSYRINTASGNGTGSSSYYWLRSIVNSDNASLLYVGSAGYVSTDTGGSYARGIAPAFSLIGSDSDKIKIVFDPQGGVVEHTSIAYDPASPLPLPTAQKFGFVLKGWNTDRDGSGTSYAIGDEISGDPGTVLFLYAQWGLEPLNDPEGEYDVYLHGNESVNIHDIPAGTAYQVWEETPDGWVLVQQSNSSGSIEPIHAREASFENNYQPGVATVQFAGTKTLDGKAAEAGTYQFSLYEGNTLIETVSNITGGFIQFSPIEYEDSDVGTHTYKIKEVDPQDNTIDYDTHTETITVEVTDDGAGNLSAVATYDADGIKFANKSRPGVLKLTKTAEGLTEENKDATFTFKITLTNPNGQPFSDDETIYWYYEDDSRITRAGRYAKYSAEKAWNDFTNWAGGLIGKDKADTQAALEDPNNVSSPDQAPEDIVIDVQP